MKKQFHGIYIGRDNRDRLGQEGVNYGMTGTFTNQPQMWPVSKPDGPLWSFVPNGTHNHFVVFIEDIYDPESVIAG